MYKPLKGESKTEYLLLHIILPGLLKNCQLLCISKETRGVCRGDMSQLKSLWYSFHFTLRHAMQCSNPNCKIPSRTPYIDRAYSVTGLLTIAEPWKGWETGGGKNIHMSVLFRSHIWWISCVWHVNFQQKVAYFTLAVMLSTLFSYAY